MIFGERIKQLRIENQWTQDFVCQKLNISHGALSRYETGMYEPKSLELIKDFANLFNVSTDYLLGKTDKRNNDNDKKELEINWALSGGYSALNDTNREIARSVIESLLAKQEQEEKGKK